ncbi:MAG TPA: HAMP domain-containing sensor histidine kinase [Tissierellaceae bacterium]|nr:HAMP domain-containing sensor histidine kinase [Tissierellaceae bacterium]
MKNYPLALQIWIVFAIITLVLGLILSFIFPMTLRDFFTNEIYSTIDSAQDIILNEYTMEDFWNENIINENPNVLEDIRSVNHVLIYGNNQIILDSPISTDFLDQIKESISKQEDNRAYYKGDLEDENLLYVITKGKSLGHDTYLVSYMDDSYRQDLVSTLFTKLLSVMGIVFLLAWIPALLLSRYLSKPLVDLESRVKNLSKNNWDESINLGRKDEIGKLGNSVEKLRKQLIRQDKAERNFLQNISHELKTPVMVIRSYSQAIKDGIFPKGDLNHSIEIVDNEAERLEKKIKNLLYFSKLDYISNRETIKENFSLDNLINEVVGRLSWNRTDLEWNVDLNPINITGDKEQWQIVLENLIDNQMRYAENIIYINLKDNDNNITLDIGNDGPHIETVIMENLFTQYNKGNKGEHGLGLAIVDRILKLHDSTIIAVNEDEGVRFRINIEI